MYQGCRKSYEAMPTVPQKVDRQADAQRLSVVQKSTYNLLHYLF